MADKEKPANGTDASKGFRQRVPDRIKRISDVSWILLASGFMVGVLLGVSWRLDEITERTKFLAGNALSILTLVVIVFQSLIYRRQREIMGEQSKAMQDGLTRTDNIIEQMKVQLTIMRTQSIAAVSEARSTREGLIETRRLVAQNEQALKAAQDNVEAVEKTAIYSQRAYLSASIEGRKGSGHLFHLIIQNSGNTPANHVEVWHSFDFLEHAPDGLDVDFNHKVRGGLIAPHTQHTIDIEYTKAISAVRYHKEFEPDRSLVFYCWGIIHYEDIFNTRRQTRFCFYQRYEHGIGSPCSKGNEAY